MARKDKGKFSDKYPADRKTRPEVMKAVKEKAEYGVIPCATAFIVVEEMNIPAEEVGFTIDRLEIRISKCQLGLFGNTPMGKIVRPESSVAPEVEEAIRGALVEGRLSCEAAWEIAKRFKLPKIRVSGVCEALNIKINSCQLNAF